MNRRHCLTLLTSSIAAGITSCESTSTSSISGGDNPRLPQTLTFKGQSKFEALVAKAQAGNWASLPLHERIVTVGKSLVGTSYTNFTLELSDDVECPCVNFQGLDCWTFYETSLAFARMLHREKTYDAAALLRNIELERYRDGHCDGTYLSRMHHLEEVFANNQARGLGRNITAELGGKPIRRQIMEMQHDWKSYRSLVAHPEYRTGIAKVEARVSNLPVTYVPNAQVPSVESSLRNGDVIAIVGADEGSYTTHVGLAVRDGARCRFMHATSRYDKGRQVVLDGLLTHYLAESSDHIGIIAFRPSEVA